MHPLSDSHVCLSFDFLMQFTDTPKAHGKFWQSSLNKSRKRDKADYFPEGLPEQLKFCLSGNFIVKRHYIRNFL